MVKSGLNILLVRAGGRLPELHSGGAALAVGAAQRHREDHAEAGARQHQCAHQLLPEGGQLRSADCATTAAGGYANTGKSLQSTYMHSSLGWLAQRLY